jgi:hypothetical protein
MCEVTCAAGLLEASFVNFFSIHRVANHHKVARNRTAASSAGAL